MFIYYVSGVSDNNLRSRVSCADANGSLGSGVSCRMAQAISIRLIVCMGRLRLRKAVLYSTSSRMNVAVRTVGMAEIPKTLLVRRSKVLVRRVAAAMVASCRGPMP